MVKKGYLDRRDFLRLSAVFFAGFVEMSINPLESFADKKKIYLTIDDGPTKHTEKILRMLEENNCKATFFFVGKKIKNFNNKNLIKQVSDLGHSVGNHSYSHPEFSKIPLEKCFYEIEKTEEIISEYTGKKPNLFRFPYGDSGGGSKQMNIQKFLFEKNYKIISWDIDSEDWKFYRGLSKENIFQNSLSAKEKEIILIHEIPFSVENLLPEIIRNYSSRGFKLCEFGR